MAFDKEPVKLSAVHSCHLSPVTGPTGCSTHPPVNDILRRASLARNSACLSSVPGEGPELQKITPELGGGVLLPPSEESCKDTHSLLLAPLPFMSACAHKHIHECHTRTHLLRGHTISLGILTVHKHTRFPANDVERCVVCCDRSTRLLYGHVS